jgi:hypothetical protein
VRDSFRAYYRPTDDELAEIWAESIIVLDTNTLLNFFRYTPSTRDEFLGVLEKLKGSLWIPHHVGLEFHRRRLGVISTTSEAFTKVTDSLTKAKNDIAATLNGYKHHPSLNRSDLMTEVSDFFQSLTEKLDTQQREHNERVIGKRDAELTFDRISDLFSDKVGKAFTSDELVSIYEEGKTRYAEKTPPGYKDKDDSNPNQYGDLVIWKAILKLGAEKKQPAIFVTDDTKEDWWWKPGGETQGPRVELVDEYWAHAERRIHFYEPLRFLEYAKERTNSQISRESLEEVEEVSSANSRAQRVLRERRGTLEDQRARLIRQFERRESESLNPSQRRALHEELESLTDELRTFEPHLEMLRDQAVELKRNFDTHGDDTGPKEFPEHFARQREEMGHLERHLLLLNRRRESIERKLRRGIDGEPRMHQVMERQMSRLQNELQEVDLALEELGE